MEIVKGFTFCWQKSIEWVIDFSRIPPKKLTPFRRGDFDKSPFWKEFVCGGVREQSFNHPSGFPRTS